MNGCISYAEGKYYFTDNLDNRLLLLDVKNIMANNSALPMHLLVHDESGGFVNKYVLDEYIGKVVQVLSREHTADEMIVVLLRIVSQLMSKHRKRCVLFVGTHPDRVLSEIASVVRTFNENNEVFLLSDSINSVNLKNIIPIITQMDKAILGVDSFDIVVLDDVAFDGQLPVSIMEKAVMALKNGGVLYLASARSAMQNIIKENVTQISNYGNLSLIETKISLKIKTRVYDNSIDYAIKDIKRTVVNGLTELGRVYKHVSQDEYDDLIDAVKRLEELVLAVYGYLEGCEIKYRLNRLKEAMIGYRLGFADLESVRVSYNDLSEELFSNDDFVFE